MNKKFYNNKKEIKNSKNYYLMNLINVENFLNKIINFNYLKKLLKKIK